MRALFVALLLAGLLVLMPSAPAQAGVTCPRTSSTVVVFGDSMTVGATPLLNRVQPAWSIDAFWGRGVLQLPRQIDRWLAGHRLPPKVAVIALGTNEQAGWTRAHYVHAIRKFPISTRIVFVNTYRPGAAAAGLSDGREYSRWMVEIAQSPTMKHVVTVANWRRIAINDPAMIRDGTHQSEKGLRYWTAAVTSTATRASDAKVC
ncbi:SGNH/GDSL hydrolase family protein [Nocardioides sp. WS12]|uniref:SGNH/GDSL hydrolase family protein n=1 Tax=Nocardioides sp. WS12 TaxID=2486272 RepID=UPI0015F78F63|nr:SGNH/GDSL hydrolase family protein [Nocardioides sp. WS12]